MKTILTILISFVFILQTNFSYSQYTDEEKSGLLFTLQEEKAAFDFYKEMFDKYNEKVFENAMNAEKIHEQNVLNLLKELNISSNEESSGEFSIKDVKNLFDEMMKRGGYSYTDALRAAARYEEKDISDLRNFSSKAENEKIKSLYQCLDKASQNHLRAFVRNLKSEGINYNPNVLSPEQYNEIINSKNMMDDCFKTN